MACQILLRSTSYLPYKFLIVNLTEGLYLIYKIVSDRVEAVRWPSEVSVAGEMNSGNKLTDLDTVTELISRVVTLG